MWKNFQLGCELQKILFQQFCDSRNAHKKGLSAVELVFNIVTGGRFGSLNGFEGTLRKTFSWKPAETFKTAGFSKISCKM